MTEVSGLAVLRSVLYIKALQLGRDHQVQSGVARYAQNSRAADSLWHPRRGNAFSVGVVSVWCVASCGGLLLVISVYGPPP